MQAHETHGVARRSLDLEDYIDLFGRHKGWIFGPLFTMVVLTVVGCYFWPDTYESKASLRILSPTLDPAISGGSPLSTQLGDRLNAMANTILSRTTLQAIIQQHDLYVGELKGLPLEDVVETMKRRIAISSLQSVTAPQGRGSVSAFSIQFSYPDRFKAQKVVGDLVSRFIAENEKEKKSALYQGLAMLRDRRDAAEKDLDTAETKLAAFRSEHQGRLPEQENAVLQQMTSLQTRLSLLNGSLSRAAQDKMMLETDLRLEDAKRRALMESRSEAAVSEAAPPSPRLLAAEREVQKFEEIVNTLGESVTEKHPDLIAAKQRLAAAVKQQDLLLRKEASTSRAVPVGSRDAAGARMVQEHEGNIERFRTQIAVKKLELEGLEREAREVSGQIRAMSGRMQGIPLSEREYSELQRDRDIAKDRFQQASASLAKMQSGYEVDSRMLGEGLEQLESPLLPQTPSEPKRPVIVGMGALLGLFLGLVTVGVREVRDTSIKSLKDARIYAGTTILASIPLIENEVVVRRRRRIAWLGWTVGILVGVALMATSVVYYYATKA